MSYNLTSISKKDLERLYLKESLSTSKIAEIYNCGKATVQERMKNFGIPARSKSEALKLIPRPEKYKISRKKLTELYWRKELSAYKIAEIYNCSPSAISSKLRRFNISRRTDVEGIILTNSERCKKIARAVSRYCKKDFSGSDSEKAYLIGFRLGDMNIMKKKYGETIYASSSTTKKEQIGLMRSLFKKFGHILVYKTKKDTKVKRIENFQFTAHLNLSFNFLLDKKDEIKKWILKNNNYFLSFLAGYTDAEGSFGVYNGFGSFALGSYDRNIIHQAHCKLRLLGIKTEDPHMMVKGGHVDKRGVRTLKDLWSLRIRRKGELNKFIRLIEPRLRHLKRKRDLLRVKENVSSRINSL